MQNLQLHQLRVAAVAKLICDRFSEKIDSHSVILGALLHDMGNIVKFNLSYFPEFLEPEGLEYWQNVKDEFVAKYGAESHEANKAIAKEIGVSDFVISLIDSVSFSRMPDTLASGSHEQKIIEYADTRVGPFGILSIPERFADWAKRYAYRYANDEEAHRRYEEQTRIALEIERQVLQKTDLRPDDIHDAAIAPLMEELKHFQVG